MTNNTQPKSIDGLQEKIGITFHNTNLLEMAVTHRSYAKIKQLQVKDNERLEFLGDAVLKLIMSEYLYQQHPEESEGFMTKIRSKVVSDKILSQLALHINLGEYIRFSHSEKRAGGQTRESNLANVFEAVLGAIYLDHGYNHAKDVFLTCYLSLKRKINLEKVAEDYKTILQEWSQARQLGVPKYAVVRKEGPDHDITFHVKVSLYYQGDAYTAMGQANSKKSAEQDAANALIKTLKITI